MDYSIEIVKECEKLFLDYTTVFFTGNSIFDKNILLKKQHSLLVQRESRKLAESENFSPRMVFITEIAGLFHDIGRFKQLREYNTFVDARSVDHGNLGHDVLLERNILSALPPEDRQIIITSTRNHNKRMLTGDFDADTLQVLKAVRDADKLDIMRVLLDEYAKGKLDETVILHLEESDEISPEVFSALSDGENPDIADFRTLTDFKLAQMAWIYDLNFRNSLHEFRKRGFYKRIKDLLPDSPQVNQICSKMLDHLEKQTPAT